LIYTAQIFYELVNRFDGDGIWVSW